MATLFVSESRLYNPDEDEYDIDLGGRPKTGAELQFMIDEFSKEIISRAFEYTAFSFDKDSISRLTSQNGYEGIAVHFVKFKGRVAIALIPLDIKGQPVIINALAKDPDGNDVILTGIMGEEDGTPVGPPKP